ncbi:MAG: hypothetical protein ACTS9Y_14160 [Methylophilus sp.]|uniref:hypothetical protein n=1 Tax=Methylophilus sp. TaxID=29541 RepID=UPI003F9FF01C
MSENHEKYHYSITCNTLDPIVLHCLRAIAQAVEKGKYPQIGWGGTTRENWAKSNNEFTIRFTSDGYRRDFISEANRLLSGHWLQISQNDADPASPQR